MIGFAYDAGSGVRELSGVFSVCYGLGCVLAVLAVRQAGLFTAVIQPPLILFVSVPAAYYLFHSGQIGGIKDLLINCGYPLIERFPLMFFTSAIVLAVGLGRWFVARSAPHDIDDEQVEEPEKVKKPKRTRAQATVDATTVMDAVEETPRRRPRQRPADTESEAPRRPRKSPRPSAAGAASRSRHARPPETEVGEPAPRPRRRNSPPVDPEPRPRNRNAPGRESRRNLPPIDSPERRERRERPYRADSGRYDRPEQYDGHERPDRGEQRRRRPSEYDAYEGFDAPDSRRSNGGSAGNGTSANRHPVSRVRYRGQDNGEPESRPRPRRPYAPDADSWEYDV